MYISSASFSGRKGSPHTALLSLPLNFMSDIDEDVMNYERIYNEFITDRSAKEQALIESGEYKERHHIVPRSMGGDDSAENLIYLTAGDHFFAHLCLAKAHSGKQWASVWSMSGAYRNKQRSKDKRWMILQRNWVEKARYEGLVVAQRGISKPCTMTPEQIAARSEKAGDSQRGIPRPQTAGEKNPMKRAEVREKVAGLYTPEKREEHRKLIKSLRSTDESKAKTSKASKEMWKSESYRENASQKRLATWSCDHHREKMRAINKESANSPTRVAKRKLASEIKARFAVISKYSGDIRKVNLDQAYNWLADNGHICLIN